MRDIPAIHSSIVDLPPELFARFCTFLPPDDLFTLSQVCRKFRGYLRAPNSFSTQQIWKESRLQFILDEVTPPPKGMSEGTSKICDRFGGAWWRSKNHKNMK